MLGPWILLQTRASCEWQALRNLTTLNITAYLPHCAEVRRRGWRKQAEYYPLFPGYIFAKPNGFAIPSIIGISGPVMFGSRVAHVEDELIEELRRRQNAAGIIDLSAECLASVKVGDQVRIESGPLAGFVGELARLNGKERAWVLIKFAEERMTRVEVSAHDLRLA